MERLEVVTMSLAAWLEAIEETTCDSKSIAATLLALQRLNFIQK
jgi:hypothetical protein